MSASVRTDRPGVTLDDEVRRIEALLLASDAAARAVVPVPPARAPGVAHVVDVLGLSPFEADVLVLAAASELDGRVAREVADLTGGADGPTDPRPTLGLALATLPQPHWDALSPERPLRRWGLVTLAPGPTLTTSRVGVDEQVLHLLAGTGPGLGALAGVVAPVVPPTVLASRHAALAAEVAATLVGAAPVLGRLLADGRRVGLDVAAAVADRLARAPVLVRVDGLPSGGPDLAAVARLLDRHLLLHGALAVLAGDHAVLADELSAPVVLTTAEGAEPLARTELRWAVAPVDAAERGAVWRAALGPIAAEGPLVGAAGHRFDAPTIAAIATEVGAAPGGPDADALRRACRARGRTAMDGLAARVDVRAGWDDLVLPDGAVALLGDLVDAVRQRTVVHDRWGFADASARGLGITALFAGDSGTGKTMAAEVVAGALDVDLFRVDLAAVVDKYIGETEKNLARVFDAAEQAGAVLLFDEADALFGKRGEVRDAHDRYANLEVSYLLQRMETYHGLAILTTNLRAAVDRAFLRRLRFVVEFPFPDETLRAAIWARAFPPATPTEDLDPVALARLRVSGGSIRSIALSAAVAAAAAGEPVRPRHVLHAARVEYAKADRTLSRADAVAIAGGAA